ncbi:MAG: response regulator transcription factor [Clostridia bacterium]
MKVLIVDDEKRLADALCQMMKQNKYLADAVYDGEDGLYYSENGDYDVIVLDVMMPKLNGFEVVRKLRERKNNTPVIMLTAKDEVASKVKGLDCGADDYLTKPFSGEELLARVRALSRRQTDLVYNELEYADLTLSTTTFNISCGDKTMSLGVKEYEILKLLMTNPTQVINKDTIISKVWGLDSDITENNVEAYMSFIRKKIDFVGSKVTISTKRKLGYFLESNVD